MALSTGARLGPYEILAPLGAGGMGEVYRAKDTRLDRTVAIKVLPSEFAGDPDARLRLEREAHAIAGLTHPHICTLYDIGHQDGIDFLVMEYLEGETLAARLTKGALPLDQVLKCATEIADALDKAHRAGIVHRDLKPSNVMLTKEGAKLLDFGLAKTTPGLKPWPTPGGVADFRPIEANAGLQPGPGATNLPTSPASLTVKGMILGTLQYMAPEQLEGKAVDARTDIFALGMVIYEMATGQKAFTGASQASLIAAILDATPPAISKLQPLTPPAFDRLTQACLAKAPDERIQDAHDVGLLLRWITQDVTRGSPIRSKEANPRRSRVTAAVVGSSLVLALISTVAAVRLWKSSRAAGLATVSRLVLSEQLPAATTGDLLCSFAISRDGRRVVYSSEVSGIRRLYLRNMEASHATPIAGTENATIPFFSPDGQRIGFAAGGHLNIVSIAGGAPIALADVGAPRGAVWATDDTIVFSPDTDAGIWRVPASGGTPQLLTAPDPKRHERSYRWPALVPGDNAIVFTAASSDIQSFDDARLMVRSLRTGEQRELLRGGSFPMFEPSGYLIYARAGALLAERFNSNTLVLEDKPTTVLDGIVTYPISGAAQVAVSADGTLLYVSGSSSTRLGALAWIDRAGRSTPIPVPPAAYQGGVNISPDGRFAAIDIDGANASVWLLDLERAALTRLTTEWSNNLPFWSADGSRVAFSSARAGVRTLFWQPVDGRSSMEPLTTLGSPFQGVGSWSPDGKTLAFGQRDPGTDWDIWTTAGGGGRAQPFVQTTFAEFNPRFAPNGRWLAYISNEGGRDDIYVQPFPGPGRKIRASSDGAEAPVWSRDGRELFYQHDDGLMAVPISSPSAELSVGKAHLLFRNSKLVDYDVGADGRFLVVEEETRLPSAPITVVLNWTRELRTRVQANGGK